MQKIKEILKNAKNIAVIGASNNPVKAAHRIPKYLQDEGYNIIPVNPNHNEILGVKSYPKLTDIPEEIEIDIVNVFRPSKEIIKILPDIIARYDKNQDIKLLWLQEGIHSKEAAEEARKRGIEFIQGFCIYKFHAAL